LTRKEMRTMRDELRQLFAALWPTDGVELTIPSYHLPVHIGGIYLTRVGAGSIASVSIAEWPSTFWVAVADLLHQYGARIRRCSARHGANHCGRLFLRTRRQIFCSPQCAQRERSREWYDEHRTEAQRRRRVAYAERK